LQDWGVYFLGLLNCPPKLPSKLPSKTAVGGRTSARRKPYRNDTGKPSNGTTSRTHM